MPIYEWKCAECGHEFEQRQDHFVKRGDKKLCPICGALADKAISEKTGFRLEGTGWTSVDSGCTPGGSRD